MNTLDKIAVRRRELENELAKLHEQEEAIREKMKYLSAEEVRRLLAEFNDPHGRMAFEKFHDALKTLEYLRPMPTGEDGLSRHFLEWRGDDENAWYVALDKRDGAIQAVYPEEDVAFDFDADQAEALGQFLLGAVETYRSNWGR